MPKDHIEKMYTAQLESQKEQLKQDYDTADEKLIASLQKAQQATDTALTRTAVESQKAAVNNAELHDAHGLSSGARAQARLAQENQLQSDLTAIRQTQLQTEADTQRQRDLLSKEYASAIRKAQSENDMAKAEALYTQAQKEEEALLAKQEAAAKLMASAGDFGRLAQLYGLTEAEAAALRSDYLQSNAPSGGSGSGGSGGTGGGGGGGSDDNGGSPITKIGNDGPVDPDLYADVPKSTKKIVDNVRNVYPSTFGKKDPEAEAFRQMIETPLPLPIQTGPVQTSQSPVQIKPQYTANVNKFISSHMTPQQAEANRISRSAYTAMIEDWMNDVELSEGEIWALNEYYGLELEKRMGKA